jgi:hypothetical protein
LPSRKKGYEPALVTFSTFQFDYDESKCKEDPFLLLYTDKPRVDQSSGLPYVRVDYKEPAYPAAVHVPSEEGATKMFAQCVVWTISPVSHTRVMQFCGRAEYAPGGNGKPQDLFVMPGRVVHGRASLVWNPESPGAPRDRRADEARRKELIELDNSWWRETMGLSSELKRTLQTMGRRELLRALNPNLERMHIETLDYPESNIPLGFFMYHDALVSDEEESILAFMAAAGARSGRSPAQVAALAQSALLDIQRKGQPRREAPEEATVQFAILVLEALQLMPNSFPYMPDCIDRNRRGKKHSERRASGKLLFGRRAAEAE